MLDHLSKLEMDHREKSSHALEFATMSKVHRERRFGSPSLGRLPGHAVPCQALPSHRADGAEQAQHSLGSPHVSSVSCCMRTTCCSQDKAKRLTEEAQDSQKLAAEAREHSEEARTNSIPCAVCGSER